MKDRDRSLTLEGLIAAQSRLAPNHPMIPVLSGKQASVEAGIAGEERVAEIFRKTSFSFLHQAYHDLQPSSDEKFQIDTFGLTPWFGNILEVKNIAGVLEFKDNPPQLIRTRDDGHKDGFESPVVQLERNYELLSDWLRKHNIRIPIYGSVVLAYPKQIVAVPPVKTRLLFPNLIPSFIRNIPQPDFKLDPETFHWLSLELLKSHQPFIPKPISESYKIPRDDFKNGVRCVVCYKFGMVKAPRTWICPFCGATDHLAHQRTLLEWFLVVSRTITNRECREFLGVEDIQVAKRILQSLQLKSEGKFRYQSYVLDTNNLYRLFPK